VTVTRVNGSIETVSGARFILHTQINENLNLSPQR
jgi:hypothetical protein